MSSTTAPTTTTPDRPAEGDLVTVDHPKALGSIYRVDKINKTTADLVDPNNPTGPTSRAHLSMLRKHIEGQPAIAAVTGVPARSLPTQAPGTVVECKRQTGYYVVLADKYDRINVAKLGGEGGRYLRMPWEQVTPVDVASILK